MLDFGRSNVRLRAGRGSREPDRVRPVAVSRKRRCRRTSTAARCAFWGQFRATYRCLERLLLRFGLSKAALAPAICASKRSSASFCVGSAPLPVRPRYDNRRRRASRGDLRPLHAGWRRRRPWRHSRTPWARWSRCPLLCKRRRSRPGNGRWSTSHSRTSRRPRSTRPAPEGFCAASSGAQRFPVPVCSAAAASVPSPLPRPSGYPFRNRRLRDEHGQHWKSWKRTWATDLVWN